MLFGFGTLCEDRKFTFLLRSNIVFGFGRLREDNKFAFSLRSNSVFPGMGVGPGFSFSVGGPFGTLLG